VNGEAVAFDLDMTLVDSRPTSRRALERLAREHGAELDVEALMSAYGLPLSRWLPDAVDFTLFRALQAQELARAVALPGASRLAPKLSSRTSRISRLACPLLCQ
jgi:beta-phosphoglucomutase-like phosphatase (HAD superfamily)